MDVPSGITVEAVADLDYRGRALWRCCTCGGLLAPRLLVAGSIEVANLALAHRDLVHGGRAE